MNSFHHQTVFLQEAVTCLNIKEGDTAIDCTAGGGGHTELLLKAVGATGKVIAIDKDNYAIDWLNEKFRHEIDKGNLVIRHGSFSQISTWAKDLGIIGKTNAILADLGVSSPQLDRADRGFSFNKDGPLDMRMNQMDGIPVSEFLDNVEERELSQIIWKYGEEPKARYIAKAICTYRTQEKILTTAQLSEIVKKSVHYSSKSKKNPATKTFQALRIFINNELFQLEQLLQQSQNVLIEGGRLAIISFHSLEDRIVKQQIKLWAEGEPYSKNLPPTYIPHKVVKIIKPFPLKISEEESINNPRARSAKLRVCEKIG